MSYRNVCKEAVDIIKYFESCKLVAYPDPKTKGDPYTIGWGHTCGVKLGDRITQDTADRLLDQDIIDVSKQVSKSLGDVGISDNQFGALVSFTYNIGIQKTDKSTLFKLVRANQIELASKEFIKWVNKGSSVEAGLTKRRLKEKALFLKPDKDM